MLRIHRFTIAAVAMAMCAASPAAAHAFISPDAKDAASATKAQVTQNQDNRSPDAANPFEPPVDMRSPDVRYGDPSDDAVPAPAQVPVRIIEVQSSGFEWGDAGIGAAGMLALVLVGVGVVMAGMHRRGRRSPIATR